MKIEASAIRAALGGREILHGVDLEADRGELVGIIGPNGSGKSTLLRCLCRVLGPTAGAVYLDGGETGKLKRREQARSMALVAQHSLGGFDFSVLEMVLMGRSPHKKFLEGDREEDRAIARSALEAVGMGEMEHRSFQALSGGEQQRVILARALAQQTPVLLLDEPTNHLDIQYQLKLMELLRGLDRTVIAALHDLNLAGMYCTRLYVMKDGAVAAQGRPEEVLTPELIRQVYGVEARVERDGAGGVYVRYCPGK